MANESTLALPAEQVETVTLTVNGRQITAPKGTNVLQAALNNGIKIPSFCWHPKLKSVGSCRMCYIEVEGVPKLLVSCCTPVAEGMVVHTESDLVRQGRKAVIEFTLINHPLDCPTCDKGGECDLQDLTFAHGFDDSRFAFQKYRFVEEGSSSSFDDHRIGPEIILNRNRCILCYKCVRANKEAFGEYDLGVYERGNIAEINAAPGEQVDNPYSGNLVEICPVGALTNTDWRYKIRVWLTQQDDSVSIFESSGINIRFWKERQKNHIYRVTARPNDAIDDGWLADVTRYGYQIATSPHRLKTPLIRKDGKQVEASWDEALELIAKRFRSVCDSQGAVCVGGIVAPWQDNGALMRFNALFRKHLKSNNVDFRTDYKNLPSTPTSDFSLLASQPFRIAQIDSSDVILTFGSDLLREHRNEYLRARKAMTFNDAQVIVAGPYATKHADISSAELVYAPGSEEAAIGALGMAAIELGVATDTGFSESFGNRSLADLCSVAGLESDDVRAAARTLATAERPSVIVGELITRSPARDGIAKALNNLDRLLGLSTKGQVAALAAYANSRGAERLGLLPQPADATRAQLTALFGGLSEHDGLTTDQMLQAMTRNEFNACFVLGADPVQTYPDRSFVEEALGKVEFLVVADTFESETTEVADVVLPLSTWAESTGDFVNLEGTVQTARETIRPMHQSKPASEIIDRIAALVTGSDADTTVDIDDAIRALLAVAPAASWAEKYRPVTLPNPEANESNVIALYVGDDPHHLSHLTQHASSLMNFVGEAYAEISSDLAARLSVGSGDTVRLEHGSAKIILAVRISEHLDSDVVLVPRNFASAAVTGLQSRSARVDRVKISRVEG